MSCLQLSLLLCRCVHTRTYWCILNGTRSHEQIWQQSAFQPTWFIPHSLNEMKLSCSFTMETETRFQLTCNNYYKSMMRVSTHNIKVDQWKLNVIYWCSGQYHSRVIQLAEPFCVIHLERGANLSCLHRPGCKSWVTHVKSSELFIVTCLSFRQGSPKWGVQSIQIHLKLGQSHSFRAEWERIMCDWTANQGFNWPWFDYTTGDVCTHNILTTKTCWWLKCKVFQYWISTAQHNTTSRFVILI